jgi:hypothetical protein
VNKAARERRDAKRAKLQACGHGKRHRGKYGCSRCRKENGATIRKIL